MQACALTLPPGCTFGDPGHRCATGLTSGRHCAKEVGERRATARYSNSLVLGLRSTYSFVRSSGHLRVGPWWQQLRQKCRVTLSPEDALKSFLSPGPSAQPGLGVFAVQHDRHYSLSSLVSHKDSVLCVFFSPALFHSVLFLLPEGQEEC